MEYERRRVEPKATDPLGRTTLGSLLLKFFGEHVAEHVRFFNERKTEGVNHLREEFQALLNREVDPHGAFVLGSRKEELEGLLRTATEILKQERPVGDRMRSVINVYRRIHEMLEGRE